MKAGPKRHTDVTNRETVVVDSRSLNRHNPGHVTGEVHMATLDSVEVRWFGSLGEEQEAALRERLQGLKERGVDVDDRPDEYLVIPTAREFGLKLRGPQKDKQGRPIPPKLEFKGRTARLGTQRLADDVHGKVECWTKWSYESPDALAIVDRARAAVVNKTRCQVKFGWNENFQLSRQKSAKDFVIKGGAFELTLATIAEKSYWSVGVEAFPSDTETISRFAEFVNAGLAFLRDEALTDLIPPSLLNEASSCSYPDWLARTAT